MVLFGGVVLFAIVELSVGTVLFADGAVEFVGVVVEFAEGVVLFGFVLFGFVLFGFVTFVLGFGKVLLIIFSRSVRFLPTTGAELGGVGLLI